MSAMSYAQAQQYTILQEQEVPDGTLVKQSLAGDQNAFEFLVTRYRRPLACYIRGMLKDDDEINDVLQHVFLQLYVSLPILLTDVSLKAWLFRVAHNRCLDELRKRRRRAEIPFSTLERECRGEEQSPVEAIPDSDPLPEEIAERIDLHGSLSRAVSALPPKFRSIIYLRCFRQLSFSQIGRTLNMPETSVKTCFYRSLPRLRRALTGSMYFIPAS
jgi:RNA polymerase sigma factor (sigma-70 family)